ncbi:hypothetical protein ACJX0J_039775, partial [Zea mays]
ERRDEEIEDLEASLAMLDDVVVETGVILMVGPEQGDYGFPDKGKNIADTVECVTPISCQSLLSCSDGELLFDSATSDSNEGLDFFAKMDEKSFERTWIFVALDIASVAEANVGQGPSSWALLVV